MYSLPEHDAPACDVPAVVLPLHEKEDGFTEAAVAARLQASGYEMMQSREIEVGCANRQIAVQTDNPYFGARLYWAVFVHRVPHLDAATLRATQEEDRAEAARLLTELANLPWSLERWLWFRVVVSIFIADTVEEDARVLLSQPLKPWCGFMPVCAARDTSDGSVHYFRGWQFKVFDLPPRLRHLIGRVLLPDVTPEQEPPDRRLLLFTALWLYAVAVITVFWNSLHPGDPMRSVFVGELVVLFLLLPLLRICDVWTLRRWTSRRTKLAA